MESYLDDRRYRDSLVRSLPLPSPELNPRNALVDRLHRQLRVAQLEHPRQKPCVDSMAVERGANTVRVHDVQKTQQPSERSKQHDAVSNLQTPTVLGCRSDSLVPANCKRLKKTSHHSQNYGANKSILIDMLVELLELLSFAHHLVDIGVCGHEVRGIQANSSCISQLSMGVRSLIPVRGYYLMMLFECFRIILFFRVF